MNTTSRYFFFANPQSWEKASLIYIYDALKQQKRALHANPQVVNFYQSLTIHIGKALYTISQDQMAITRYTGMLEGTWQIKKEKLSGLGIGRARFALASLLTTGDIYCSGGFADKAQRGDVYRYSIPKDEWTQAPSLVQARSQHGSCSVKNALYVFGGYVDLQN